MIEASCHCGAVVLTLAETPTEVTECNCSICRRYGVLWAYDSPASVVIRERTRTDVYLWGDREIRFHRCSCCGCVTHWLPVDGTLDRMGVNARLLDPELARTLARRHLDGA